MNAENVRVENAVSNEKSLQELAWAIQMSGPEFSLILARCNYASLRDRLVKKLQEICPVEIVEVRLEPDTEKLYSTLREQVGDRQPSAVMVLGLESVKNSDRLFASMNSVREEFRKNCPFPLILWVNDEILRKMIRLAPDFKSWRTLSEFAIAPEELIDFIRETSNSVFAKTLEAGEGRFLTHSDFNLEPGSPLRNELETARKKLQNQGIKLEPELEGSLEFLLGRLAENWEESRRHYERSIALLETSENLERCGCVLYYLGVWWGTYAVVHQAEFDSACDRARDYFQQSVEAFERANRPDWVAKFINAVGEPLQRLKQWEKLEEIARKSLALHQKYNEPFRLARAYGFLAEVALAKSECDRARELAEKAIEIVSHAWQEASPGVDGQENLYLEWVRSYQQGWYLFALGRAQAKLGEIAQAIATLESAKTTAKPQYDPPLYSRILKELQQSYFTQKEYLKAFEIKQERLSIEQQYGFRAFIGAGRLRSKKKLNAPVLLRDRKSASLAQEIAASGREEDIKNLVARIRPDKNRLTIIHGQSGVGKSSILQAGLIPTFQNTVINTRDILPVPQRVYTHWIEQLGKSLAKALDKATGSAPDPGELNSIPAICDRLKTNAERNLLTVLIFDQFEEFFFTCKEPQQRKVFYQFLQQCLDIDAVKVVLSLREDYLHYLLECNKRLVSLDVVNNDILGKDILYYLGNFSPESARSIIQNLTTSTQFYLEPQLIEELVKDLAADIGEVRPIEMQIVGAQLQNENITTLKGYREFGPKQKLVERYLAEVVKDCGPENERAAQLVLYLLTNENNTRPLKTKAELAAELAAEADKLDVVLQIFVKSGLVFLLHDSPANRYQLVHDYLVAFIRQQKGAELIAELEREKAQRKVAEGKLNRFLKRAAIGSTTAAIFFALSTASAVVFWDKAEQQKIAAERSEIKALNSESEARLLASDRLGALLASVKAGKQLQETQDSSEIQQQTVQKLQNALFTDIQERNRLQHDDDVISVSFSPDGETIASVSADYTIKLWRLDGSLIRSLKEHNDKVVGISFSPDGKMIASASYDRTVKLWSIDGTLLHTFPEREVFNSVSFSPNGDIIAATTTYTNSIKLWKSDGTPIGTLGKHGAWVITASFSPDGKTLVSADLNGIIKLWRLDGTVIKTFQGHSAPIYKVVFSPDGEMIATASADKTVKLWRRDGSVVATLVGHIDEVSNVRFSPDGETVASVSNDKTIKLWKPDGRLLTTIEGHSGFVWDISFSPDGKTLASASSDNTIKLWQFDNPWLTVLRGHQQGVTSVRFSPNGEKIASGSHDKTIRIWQGDGTALLEIPDKTQITSVTFSPDGQTIASGGYDKTVKLWQSDGKLMKTLEGHDAGINQVIFSPNGEIIASASTDATVKLWQRDGKLIQPLTGFTKGVTRVSFSPDGEIIAAASEDNSVKLWRLDGTAIATLERHTRPVKSVNFSPDGQTIATASTDRTVKLWRRDGSLIQTLEGNSAAVNDVIFSPDGNTLLSATEDKNIALWRRDPDTEQFELRPYKILLGHHDWVYSLSFSPDGEILASASEDDTVILWNWNRVASVNLETLLDSACTQLRDYLQNSPSLEEEQNLCNFPE